jgi:hypothetical protein
MTAGRRGSVGSFDLVLNYSGGGWGSRPNQNSIGLEILSSEPSSLLL